MNIKTLLSIMALAALTACGDGCETVDAAAVTAPVVIETAPTAPAPVVEPVLTKEPDDCPKNAICLPTPAPSPAPSRPIVIEPNPTPACVRDTSIALVLVDGFWVDNCGNKYGQTTV